MWALMKWSNLDKEWEWRIGFQAEGMSKDLKAEMAMAYFKNIVKLDYRRE